MEDLKRIVTGIGLMVFATYLVAFGGVAMFGPVFEEEVGVVLWLGSPLVALPGFYYLVTVSPGSDGSNGSDAETKP